MYSVSYLVEKISQFTIVPRSSAEEAPSIPASEETSLQERERGSSNMYSFNSYGDLSDSSLFSKEQAEARVDPPQDESMDYEVLLKDVIHEATESPSENSNDRRKRANSLQVHRKALERTAKKALGDVCFLDSESSTQLHKIPVLECSFQHIKEKADWGLPTRPRKAKPRPPQYRPRNQIFMFPKKEVELPGEVESEPETVHYVCKPLEDDESVYVAIRKEWGGEGVVGWGLSATPPDVLNTYLSPPYCDYDCTYRLVYTHYRKSVLNRSMLYGNQGFLMNVPREGHIKWQGSTYKMEDWQEECTGRPVWLFFLIIGDAKVSVSATSFQGITTPKTKLTVTTINSKPQRRKTKVLRRLSMTEPSTRLQKIRKRSLTSGGRDFTTKKNLPKKDGMECECRECGRRKCTHIVLPCGHLVLCIVCAEQPPKCCPFCFKKICEVLCIYPEPQDPESHEEVLEKTNVFLTM